MIRLLRVGHGYWGSCCRRRWWRTPTTVSRCCWSCMVNSIGRRSAPLVYYRSVRNVGIVSRLSSFNLNLLILDIHIVFGNSLVNSAVTFEAQKTEAPRFLLLLVVHYNDFCDTSIATEITSKIGLRDAGRKAAQENFWPVGVFLGLLHGSRIAWFWIDCSAVQVVWTALNHAINVVRITKRYKAKTSRSSSFCVFHYNAIYHIPKPRKVSQKCILCCLP